VSAQAGFLFSLPRQRLGVVSHRDSTGIVFNCFDEFRGNLVAAFAASSPWYFSSSGRAIIGTFVPLCEAVFSGKLTAEVTTMVIVALFGSLVCGGALFAFFRNAGAESAESQYTKLDIS
jgi:hypothetical protein